jgi:hypothetical protein
VPVPGAWHRFAALLCLFWRGRGTAIERVCHESHCNNWQEN